MSTWEENYYIDDMISFLATNADSSEETANFLVKHFYTTYGHFNMLELKDRILSDKRQMLRHLYPNYRTGKDKTLIPSIMSIMTDDQSVCYGLQATYELITKIYNGKFLSDELELTTWKHDVCKQLISMSHMASMGSGNQLKEVLNELLLPKNINEILLSIDMSAQALTHLAFAWRERDYQDNIDKAIRHQDAYPPLPKDFFNSSGKFVVYAFRQLVVLKCETDNKLYFLLRKDILRLEMLCRSLSRAVRYYATLTNDRVATSDTIIQFISYFVETLTKDNRPNEVCKAWDVMFNVYVTKQACDVWTKSYDEQLIKFDTNKYSKIISIPAVTRLLSSLPIHVCFDLLKIYKILPPPDFDPVSGFLDNKVYHDNPWSYGVAHPDMALNEPRLELSDEEFYKFQKLQLLRRTYRLMGQCPGFVIPEGVEYMVKSEHSKLSKYPNIHPNKLHLDELKYINIENAGRWEYKNVSSPDIYTDKSSPPNDMDLRQILDGTAYYALPPSKRNYLMYYLSSSDHTPTITTGLTIPSNPMFHQVTAHFKSESKKPSPRNFYSAKPQARILMSEWESNVEHFLEKDVAAFISKDPQARAEALHNLLGIDYDVKQYRVINVSFDLDKWSPRFSKEGKIASTRVWKEFFGSETSKHIPDLAHDIDIHYFHHGIHLNYNAKTLDPEGMWGKTNTAYHEDVMAFAVRKIIQLGYLKHPAKLAVFIDDGLLTLKFDKDTTNQQIAKVMTILEHIYYFYGFRIAWDKTLVSENYATFLSEYYYKRSHIDMPFRAFLKMQRTKVINEISPLGQVKALSAMARSSTQLGVAPNIVLYCLAQEVMAVFSVQLRSLRTHLRINPLEMALFLLTPTALGGIGLQTEMEMLQNPTGDAIENFYGLATYISSITSNMGKYMAIILNQEPRTRSNLSILRAPTSMQVRGPHLSDMKHYRMCAPRLVSQCANNILKWVFGQDLHYLADNIMHCVSDKLSYIDLQLLYDQSPISVYDKFLSRIKRGATILGLLTYRGRQFLQTSYKNEATRVFINFITTVRA